MVLPVCQVSEGSDWVEVGVAMSNRLSNALIIVATVLVIAIIVWQVQPDKVEYRKACEAAGGVSTHHGCLVKLEVR